jgi:hypothetical protein
MYRGMNRIMTIREERQKKAALELFSTRAPRAKSARKSNKSKPVTQPKPTPAPVPSIDAWGAKDIERQARWAEKYVRAEKLGLKAEMRRLLDLGYRPPATK